MKIQKFKLSIAEISEASGECIALVHDAIKAGHLDSFLVGRRRYCTPNAVSNWIDFLKAESDAGRPVVYRARSSERKLPDSGL